MSVNTFSCAMCMDTDSRHFWSKRNGPISFIISLFTFKKDLNLKSWSERDLTVFQEKIICFDGVLLKGILSSFQSFNLYSKIVSNQKDESLFVTH